MERTLEDIGREVGLWGDVLHEVRARHAKYDAKMIADYLRHADLNEKDLRFVFQPGDRVLLKQRKPGKLQIKAVGPFVFVQYTGALQVTAKIVLPAGTT